MSTFICNKCKEPSTFLCHRCLEPYCSIKCQILDWREHKVNCFKMPSLISVPEIFQQQHVDEKVTDKKIESPEPPKCSTISVHSINSEPPKCSTRSMNSINSEVSKRLIIEQLPSKRENPKVTMVPTRSLTLDTAPKFNQTEVKLPAWKRPFAYAVNTLLNVVILTIEDRGWTILWVSEAKYNNQYFEFITSIKKDLNKTPAYNQRQLTVGAAVCVFLQEFYHRGEIINFDRKSQTAEVQLIDVGKRLCLPFDVIFPGTPETINTPAYAFPICVPKTEGPFKVEDTITVYVSDETLENGIPFAKIKPKSEIVKEVNRESMDRGAAPAIEENIMNLSVNEKPKKSLNNTRYTYSDLKLIPINVSDDVQLIVLDASSIQKGFITASDFSNREFLQQIENDLGSVHKYCVSVYKKEKYRPNKDEICLAIYDVDKSWYRALCVKVCENDKFLLLFIDYGNNSVVYAENIMPITSKLMFASNANLCYLEGLSNAQCEKFVNLVLERPIFRFKVKKVEGSDDTYDVFLHESEMKRLI